MVAGNLGWSQQDLPDAGTMDIKDILEAALAPIH